MSIQYSYKKYDNRVTISIYDVNIKIDRMIIIYSGKSRR